MDWKLMSMDLTDDKSTLVWVILSPYYICIFEFSNVSFCVNTGPIQYHNDAALYKNFRKLWEIECVATVISWQLGFG